ncbi:MAG: AmmeMemoRadiSam system protein A [Chloroflexi bacterium]|nr:AmmeMemoRadiSam system protein A [Chloroflexota bacterium]
MTTYEVPRLSEEEGQILVRIARRTLEDTLLRGRVYEPDLEALPPALRRKGASFVTLTQGGNLRGCIGSVIAHQPLALDVRDNAIKAALADPRFPPMRPEELPYTDIEVSVLTPPMPLEYRTPEELLEKIIPGKHGLLLVNNGYRGLFLPQVWEKIPDKVTFLEQLSLKAGLPMDAWRDPNTQIFVFEVQDFHEKRTGE